MEACLPSACLLEALLPLGSVHSAILCLDILYYLLPVDTIGNHRILLK
jgi:hypothetical protein